MNSNTAKAHFESWFLNTSEIISEISSKLISEIISETISKNLSKFIRFSLNANYVGHDKQVALFLFWSEPGGFNVSFFSSNTAKHFLAPNKVSLHVSEIVSGIISGTISEIISKNISEIISKLIAETIAELISEILPTLVVFLSWILLAGHYMQCALYLFWRAPNGFNFFDF